MAALAFMVPLGIAQGAATRVGNLIGAGASPTRRSAPRGCRSAWAPRDVALGAVLFVLLRGPLPRIYTPDAAVIAACAAILPIAGAFQIFDGTQVVGCGVLRGMGRTRAPVFNLVSYWVLGLPIGWWLALERGWGLAGIWWGLCLGLVVVASALLVWVRLCGSGERLAD